MITAKIIADSIANGVRITTFELEYPRFIHAEVMTHRVFSRNAASSRAIPAKALRKLVWEDPAMPVHWGKNKSGMQADEELSAWRYHVAKDLWKLSGKVATGMQYLLEKVGLHKQITNRIIEPWQNIKVVLTTTEMENYVWLRDHEDAQPEIAELAGAMVDARLLSVPNELGKGEWHLPYVNMDDFRNWMKELGKQGAIERALAVSASCCAQVSYRKLDDSIEKAIRIYDMLINGRRVHASPFEHQATPVYEIEDRSNPTEWPKGITHIDKDYNMWSGNFKNWIQHRQLIPNHDPTK